MYTSAFQSPLGFIAVKATGSGLLSVSFIDDPAGSGHVGSEEPENDITTATITQLQEYFAGARTAFDLPLSPSGTSFQQSVWAELVKVPFGKTDSYSAIANRLNNPLSVRAVGAANGKNPIAIIIPCHRIIGADGSLTGYAGGLWRKESLLNLEGRNAPVQAALW